MYTVSEVSRISGVSVRTLHYYDHIGLLAPSSIAQNGYRAYDDDALARLQQILMYRELGFSLAEVQQLLSASASQRDQALARQIDRLEAQLAHQQRILSMAKEMKEMGTMKRDFEAFDSSKLERYDREAEAAWGHTDAWQEHKQRSRGRSSQQSQMLAQGLMQVLSVFQELKQLPPEDATVQRQVEALKEYITRHFYTCTDQILGGLGQMYAAGGEMTENIDRFGGEGTAACAARAIAAYCREKA